MRAPVSLRGGAAPPLTHNTRSQSCGLQQRLSSSDTSIISSAHSLDCMEKGSPAPTME